MSAPRTVIVVNPKSQGGRLGRVWRDLAEPLRRAFPFDEVLTTGRGDATELTAAALRGGAERIVAVGGDGTIHEVVNGFFDVRGKPLAPRAALAVLPFGTGGDFRRTLDLPREASAVAAMIAADHRRTIDLGRLELTTRDGGKRTVMFANIASFGASGVVDRLINASGKKLGRVSFAIASVRAVWGYKNKRVQLRLDGGAPIDATINTVAVANGRYFGGGMKIAPAAEIDDGQLEVVVMGDFTFGEVVSSGRRLYAGSHVEMDKVSVRRARVVEAEPVDAGDPVELDVDGEDLGILPARFEVVPQALSLIVPAGLAGGMGA